MERRTLVSSIVRDYKGDAFVSLLSIVTNGHHDRTLRSAYDQLSTKAKESFLYTSLLYRFKIMMPSSLLMKLVSKDWNEFKKDVMEYDAKGILVQEEKIISGDTPDLYFRTRHPVISERLIQIYLGDSDKRFLEYQKIFKKITYSPYSSGLIINILKAMRNTEEFTQAMINELFDLCASEFAPDPHFNLHYAINLQYRDDTQSLRRGIERIIYAEGFLDRRNHRLIHRRVVLNFRLARLLDREQAPRNTVRLHIDETRDLFEIKAIEDPFSIYSYREYLYFEIWYLKTFSLTEELKLRTIISIENLLDQAKRQLHEGIEAIAKIEADYRMEYNFGFTDNGSYIEFIHDLDKKPDMKPYALILYFFYYTRKNDKNNLRSKIVELEKYKYLNEVAKLLFRYYGQNLHCSNNLIKLFSLANSNENLVKQDPIQYHFFLAIAEAYNRRFQFFRQHMQEIRERFGSRFQMHDFWRDDEGNPAIFDAIIMEKRNNRLYVHIIDLQYDIPLFIKGKNPSISTTLSSRHKVQIRFYAGGMTALVVQPKDLEAV